LVRPRKLGYHGAFTGSSSTGVVMGRFLVIAAIVAVVVVGVLYYTGFDVISQLTDDIKIKEFLPPRHFTTNLVAGIISGLIVAVITAMFARR
jgi:amino acid transporter